MKGRLMWSKEGSDELLLSWWRNAVATAQGAEGVEKKSRNLQRIEDIETVMKKRGIEIPQPGYPNGIFNGPGSA